MNSDWRRGPALFTRHARPLDQISKRELAALAAAAEAAAAEARAARVEAEAAAQRKRAGSVMIALRHHRLAKVRNDALRKDLVSSQLAK